MIRKLSNTVGRVVSKKQGGYRNFKKENYKISFIFCFLYSTLLTPSQ